MNRLLAAVICGALCACVDDPTDDARGLQTVTYTVQIEATMPGSTRTELAPDGFNVLWTPGDRIGVFVKSGDTFTTLNAPLTYEGTIAAASGRFSGDITLTEGASYTLYAYYPYAEQASPDASAVPFTLPTQQVQPAAGQSTHLGEYDFLVAGAVTASTIQFPALIFRHAFAVVEANLTGSGVMAGKTVASAALFSTDASSVQPNGTLTDMANMAGNFTFDLTSGSANNTAVYTGGSTQIGYCILSFGTAPVLGPTPLKVYFTINPADYSRGDGHVYLVVRTVDDYTATYSRPGLVISPAQMKVIRQDISTGAAPQPAVDLTASGETANCYVVSVPSQEYSFTASTAGNGVITTGLQQAVQRYEGRTLSASLSGASARLLWQSRPYLIEPGSISYAAGRIRFSLTQRPTVLGGNAVIGLFPNDDPDAEALWSWHVWITDKNNEDLQAMAETYIMYAPYEDVYGRGAAVMMDRNLGAIYKEDNAYARSFRAPLFQWGRKDPFPWGTVVFDEQNVPYNYLLRSRPVQTSGALGQYAGYTGNTYYATAHPDIFIATTRDTSYDWYYGAGGGTTAIDRNDELWGNPLGYNVGETTTKTLFDPCPPGWKVPHPYVFSAFTKTGGSASVASGETKVAGSFIQGWNLYYGITETTYYPGVGYRYDEFGIFIFDPSGYYWTSSPGPSDRSGAWTFGLTSTKLFQRIANPRGIGYPLRCMRDLPMP